MYRKEKMVFFISYSGEQELYFAGFDSVWYFICRFRKIAGICGLCIRAFGLLSAITVIVIINRPGNPGFKLAWMVPLTLIPVFGVLMYIFVEMQVGVRIMNKKLNDTSKKNRESIRCRRRR